MKTNSSSREPNAEDEDDDDPARQEIDRGGQSVMEPCGDGWKGSTTKWERGDRMMCAQMK